MELYDFPPTVPVSRSSLFNSPLGAGVGGGVEVTVVDFHLVLHPDSEVGSTRCGLICE